ncbi:MAG: N(4)-(beta-N-acetylglucosaminyl)-L-asparaginase [Bacteroidota bacterium]
MSDRRKFVKVSLLSSMAVLVGKNILGQTANKTAKKNKHAKAAPIVISTWDFGRAANTAAWDVLSTGGKAIDAVETGVRVPEADPNNQSVGLGGRPDRDGRVTLDACIMDEHSRCGSVACLEHIVHAISVARMVKDKTPHVMLAGDGALQFALDNGFKKENLLTEKSEREWKEWLKKADYKPKNNIENYLPGGERNHDTIGMLAMDSHGDLSGACTTSGMAFKMHGRVGDSPIIGAALYVDNEVGAATCSGLGEEVIRVVAGHLVVELMRNGLHPTSACRQAIERIATKSPNAKDIQVGILAMNNKGEYGAFALQSGFTYAVKSGSEERLYESGHLFK